MSDLDSLTTSEADRKAGSSCKRNRGPTHASTRIYMPQQALRVSACVSSALVRLSSRNQRTALTSPVSAKRSGSSILNCESLMGPLEHSKGPVWTLRKITSSQLPTLFLLAKHGKAARNSNLQMITNCKRGGEEGARGGWGGGGSHIYLLCPQAMTPSLQNWPNRTLKHLSSSRDP